MANDLAGNPWVIDTASANAIDTGNTVHARKGIDTIVFSGYTTGAADQAVMTFRGSAKGLTLQGRADKTHVEVDFPRPAMLRDIAVSTLSSGVVLFFLAD